MTLKMFNIIDFEAFYNEVKSSKMPLKVAYKLANLSKAIEDQLAFYREKLQEILAEYGQKDENGNLVPTEDGQGIKLLPGVDAECFTKVNELQTLEIELPDIQFEIEEFGDIEISPKTLGIIIPFLK